MSKENEAVVAVAETETETETKRAKRGTSLLAQAKAMFQRIVIDAESNERTISEELFTEAIALFERLPQTPVAGEPADVQLKKVEDRIAHLFATHFEDGDEDELRLLLNRKKRLVAEVKGEPKKTRKRKTA